ncbi:hypothetical protein ATCC90586_010360 [Pythium insidiosum]|nr:hypothetical protein ATCC90586_010360 [Pythium insidiosum]
MFRGRILDPAYQGYRPHRTLELVLRSCIGSIIRKPQWWLKWRGLLPAKRSHRCVVVKPIAEKWLDEIVTAVLQNRFYWMTKKWKHWLLQASAKDLQTLVGYPRRRGGGHRKRLRLFYQDERTAIAYEMVDSPDLLDCEEDEQEVDYDLDSEGDGDIDDDEADFDDDAGCIDEEEDDGEDANTNENDSGNESQNHRPQSHRLAKQCEKKKQVDSTSFLCWYFSVLEFSGCVKDQAEHGWPADEEFSLTDAKVHRRAIALIKLAHSGDISKQTFTTLYPDADDRPHAVDLVWFHVERAVEQVKSVRACVRATLDDLIDRYDLMNPASAKTFISPGPVVETWMSDSIVPADVKAKFVREVSILEDVPDEQKDWHPGSNNQVLDLVHPSLYCCVYGETRRVTAQDEPEEEERSPPAEQMYRAMFQATEVVGSQDACFRYYHQPLYQWIPSDFRVDGDGNVKILSYINNLHPVLHREMYDSIEKIFSKFVPLVPAFPEIPPQLTIGVQSPMQYTMKGTTVQVITKIAEIHLTPENPVYPGGSWHIEGTETESIVATGIYYFGCENITESKLSFRVIVHQPPYDQNDDMGVATTYGLENEDALIQNLGAATAIENRCIVFPNTLQHKVEPFKLADPTKPGVRKILAFFIVDPSKKIPSTSVIPPQQQDWLQEARRENLSNLPEVVVDGPLSDMLNQGMTIYDPLGARQSKRLAPFRRALALSSRFPDEEHAYLPHRGVMQARLQHNTLPTPPLTIRTIEVKRRFRHVLQESVQARFQQWRDRAKRQQAFKQELRGEGGSRRQRLLRVWRRWRRWKLREDKVRYHLQRRLAKRQLQCWSTWRAFVSNEKRIRGVVMDVQRVWRGYKARQRYVTLREAAHRILRVGRGWMARHEAAKSRLRLEVLQCLEQLKNATSWIQFNDEVVQEGRWQALSDELEAAETEHYAIMAAMNHAAQRVNDELSQARRNSTHIALQQKMRELQQDGWADTSGNDRDSTAFGSQLDVAAKAREFLIQDACLQARASVMYEQSKSRTVDGTRCAICRANRNLLEQADLSESAREVLSSQCVVLSIK